MYAIFFSKCGVSLYVHDFCKFYEDTLQNSWQVLSGSSSITCNWTLPWKVCWNKRMISIMIAKLYLLFCTYVQADQTYKSTKVYVPDREWDLSHFKFTTTNCNKRMHYNHLNWHLFPLTISIQLVVFCSIYYYCSQTCLHQQNILRITCLTSWTAASIKNMLEC